MSKVGLRAWLLAFLGVAVAGVAQASEIKPSICTAAIATAEAKAGLPAGVLMAIGFGEAGRKVEGGATVWPWTINVEGKGHFFETKADVIAHVEKELATGVRSIDVGCMQVNLRWHEKAFANLDEAFDPLANATYAASFLQRLQAAVGGDDLASWQTAVGHYHSFTPERAQRYRAYVQRFWDKVDDPIVLASLGGDPAAVSTAAAAGGVASARPPVRLDDPFGLELVAYWSTPFGAEIGPSDEPVPLFDTSVRPPFATAAEAGPQTSRPQRPARGNQQIRRFNPLPTARQAPSEPAPTRTGLLKSSGSGKAAKTRGR